MTFLWWEPFIQGVFEDALKIAKKLDYKVLVTTNATTLYLDSHASKFLPYIDELILSFQAIDKDLQQKISRTNVFVDWEKVFENIKKYWKWDYLKTNTVITRDNLWELLKFVEYIYSKGVKNMAIAYPDIVKDDYYTNEHIKTKIAPTYTESIWEIIKVVNFTKRNNINLKVTDFPFCVFPRENLEEYIKITDDFDYGTRVKITNEEEKLDRRDLKSVNEIPRDRFRIDKCEGCIYKWKCWWPSRFYEKLFWLDEIEILKGD